MKLSILICTIPGREEFLDRLQTELFSQAAELNALDEIEFLVHPDEGISIGQKRNELLEQAKGAYLAFHDDDDLPDKAYLNALLEGIASGRDCVSLRGIYYVDGVKDGVFEHSIIYKKWDTNANGQYIKYERMPNHLNCIKSSIAKQIQFQNKNFAEDHQWSIDLQKSGLIRSEFYTHDVLYHYYYRSKK